MIKLFCPVPGFRDSGLFGSLRMTCPKGQLPPCPLARLLTMRLVNFKSFQAFKIHFMCLQQLCREKQGIDKHIATKSRH